MSTTSLLLKYASLVALVFQTTAAVILARYLSVHAAREGTAPFIPIVVVAAQELAKLFLSLLLIMVVDYRDCLQSMPLEVVRGQGSTGAAADLPEIADQWRATALLRLQKVMNQTPQMESSDSTVADADTVEDQCGPSPQRRAHLCERIHFTRVLLHFFCFAQLRGALRVSIPALLYTVQNSIIYVALRHLDATAFQVGYQSKILFTGVLTVLLLPDRRLSVRQWAALALLMGGIVCAQLDEPSSTATRAPKLSTSTTPPPMVPKAWIGMLSVLVAAFCSGCAGVYFERVMKVSASGSVAAPLAATARRFGVHDSYVQWLAMGPEAYARMSSSDCIPDQTTKVKVGDVDAGHAAAPMASVWMRNAQLAWFSWLLAMAGVATTAYSHAYGNGNGSQPFTVWSLFQGWNDLVVVMIAIQAGGGLIIAMVIRYADNILKCFATALSIVVCGLASTVLTGEFPGYVFMFGTWIVVSATFLYSV